MTDVKMQDFSNRLNRIEREHRKLANGYVTSVNHDGLIVARPRTRGPRFPWKGLMLTVALLMLFKGFLFLTLGAGMYNARVEKLGEGTAVEKVGAYVMQADPVTQWVAMQIKLLVPGH